jgi:deoxyribodipyrimidine photo-lyase
MQASQRAVQNHALEYAIDRANDLSLPAVVLFCLMDNYPEATLRHYAFMLEGLRETVATLRDRGIGTAVLRGSPLSVVPRLSRQAALVVTDRGYLRHQRRWRAEIAERIDCPMVEVESDAVVPVEAASPKAEYTAATLRPKLGRLLLRYLVPVAERVPAMPLLQLAEETLRLDTVTDIATLLDALPVDRSVRPVTAFRGGTREAMRLLRVFLEEKLDGYAVHRSDPSLDWSSRLSPYLHFGQVSPLAVALAADEHRGPGADVFLDELIVRRELSLNFVSYNTRYDSFDALPEWARRTLREHEADARPYAYDRPTLETARTHDAYWNAAQQEMLRTGSMHNYMRMYWGKKLLEWSASPSDAFATALWLNNRWQLDGRDPNSYAGVAWCFGMHDRPWAERPVFGKVRYMNAAGLERKFHMNDYVAKYAARG